MHLQNIDSQCLILRQFLLLLRLYSECVVVFCGFSNILIYKLQLAVKSDNTEIT